MNVFPSEVTSASEQVVRPMSEHQAVVEESEAVTQS